ncbi:MAG TPA: DNA ligase D, partial [Saprospiraceae bacterium]|nr:DNA ligase D [Saprospiraceae bacterium]
MSLDKYNKKRNFKSTDEPPGKMVKSEKELIFVVQKHAASHLHYDFRLEMEGSLKSWAVPKGPSMNPEDKRLAIMVEDHPFSYKDFEGNIPEGNYGAGNVIVWDKGSYTATDATNYSDGKKKLKAGLLKGHLAIFLKGEKLKGEFDLVHLKGKQENAWLLIKKSDEFATDTDILKKNKSVISNRRLETLEKKKLNDKEPVKVKDHSEKSPKVLSTPRFLKPMLAETFKESFDKKEWLFEVKFDGYRTISVINENEIKLYSRNEVSFNSKFKQVADDLKKLDHSAVLDGEVVIEDKNGQSNFQLLQNFQKTGKGNLKYYVFDILNLDGNDTRSLSLLERKELLNLLIAKYKFENIYYSDHILEKGKAFYELAIKKNLEGIMAKDATSPYRSGKRSSEWLKIKITQQEEAIIIGITEPKASRKYFGALLLAQYIGNKFVYIGNCGSGFNENSLKDLYSKFKSSFIDTSPLAEKIKLKSKVQWISPKYLAQIKFTEITQDGHLRHPVFLGLREDKTVKDLEADSSNSYIDSTANNTVMDTKKSNGNDFDLKIGKITLHLTNQNKIYFPEDGSTKGDVVNYYKEVADIMLPYLKDRPQSMNRFPNGINGPSFFQKDIDVEKVPTWLKTTVIYSESNNKNIDYLLCNDAATLVFMANLGCIEINPWNSRIGHIENPDWMVIDIDPAKEEFNEVVKTALIVKDVMDEFEADCYCKTSGATGLHVYVPLAAKYEYDTVKIFAELIAHTVNLRLPDTTTIIRPVQKRDHKIYIDFLQNRRGQTLAAPYSVRPRPGAPVSTPLEWNEVNEKLSPSNFTIKNILKRLDKKGDLWKPVIGKGVDIEA